MTRGVEVRAVGIAGVPQPNTELNIKVAKLQTFNGKVEKILGFLAVYRLYIRIRMRKATIKNKSNKCYHMYKGG